MHDLTNEKSAKVWKIECMLIVIEQDEPYYFDPIWEDSENIIVLLSSIWCMKNDSITIMLTRDGFKKKKKS